ncbi:MAG: RecX family transcriptional regulator [Ruminococcus sp.]|nr:RecX family transcriptional regulator [Ruminococcus sp.]
MQITTLSPYKGNTWKIAFDDEETLYFLNVSVVEKFSLKKEMEISEQEWERICNAELCRKAYSRACYLLDYRGYSYQEMYHKLEKTYPSAVCFAVVNRLAKQGLINDHRYAEQLAYRYIIVKGYGFQRAKQEMRRRELLDAQIDEALEPFAERTLEILAERVAEKYAKYFADASDRQQIEKGKAALVRQGYSFGEVNRAVKTYLEEQEKE